MKELKNIGNKLHLVRDYLFAYMPILFPTSSQALKSFRTEEQKKKHKDEAHGIINFFVAVVFLNEKKPKQLARKRK